LTFYAIILFATKQEKALRRRKMQIKCFKRGLVHGLPIALGYLAVSISFGVSAVNMGLTVLEVLFISMANMTSAGQLAGAPIIATGGNIFGLGLGQLFINLRYSLMSVSLSQKLDSKVTLIDRLLIGFGVTDEIFAVAFSRGTPVTPTYMYGMIAISFIGWVGGTLAGAMAGELLPATIVGAMGITLYGMFLAIIIPVARKKRGVLFVIAIAALFSIIFKYLIPSVSSGFAMIISGVGAAIIGALLFPIKETEGEV
jgi:predicted branched-subunit amino acid permease